MKYKTENIIIRVEPNIKAEVEKIASNKKKTLSAFILSLLNEEIERNNKMKIYTADRETGTFIEEFETIEKAKSAIKAYEKADKIDGSYEENFYDIVDGNHCTLINN